MPEPEKHCRPQLSGGARQRYKATKDVQFLTFVSNNQNWSDVVPELSWDNKFVGAQAVLAKEYLAGKKDLARYKTHADGFVNFTDARKWHREDPNSTRYQILLLQLGQKLDFTCAFLCRLNQRQTTNAVMVLFYYSNLIDSAGIGVVQCSSANFSAAQIRAFAKSQVDYTPDNSPLGYSYLVGYGTKYPQRIHHRGASTPSIKVHPAKVECGEGFADFFNTHEPNTNIHTGAIVGGPNSLHNGFKSKAIVQENQKRRITA
ncbi:endoglucanase-like [Elaeis guineensis]|uniref:endoglucanase-like n=1 Tax=Elaeis guineensis var. tenera TaxID=51953 RepID=UPI003C6D11A2